MAKPVPTNHKASAVQLAYNNAVNARCVSPSRPAVTAKSLTHNYRV
jgi:hypothetical protein